MEDSKDFNLLIERMSTKQPVLLGESTHETQEFYEIRRKISKELIENHGFDFIAVEGDWESNYELNRYVKGLSERKSATEIIRGFDRWPNGCGQMKRLNSLLNG